MLKKILLGIGAIVLVFVSYVSVQPNSFHYERSGVINASPEKVFSYLNDFKLGSQWSPYERMDPNMKKTYSGPSTGVGSVMQFEAKPDVGTGRLEILKEFPNALVQIKLEMFKPFKGNNIVEYKLTPEAGGTRFTWAMSGESNFVTKAFGVLFNCEKMVGDQFSQGIQNLKSVVESKK